jgi:DNA-binding MarR family transcriptional regulator
MAVTELTRAERWARTMPLIRGLMGHLAREGEDRLRPLGLTRPQAWVLRLLDAEGGGRSSVDLAQEMHCHSSNLTGVLDRLEARGLVRRDTHEQDRRVKVVRLTEAGVAARAEVSALMADVPAVLARLDAEDLTQLEALLTKALGHAGPDAGGG